MESALSRLAHPSAIWLRQELPVQRKRTLSLFIGLSFIRLSECIQAKKSGAARLAGDAGLSQLAGIAGELRDIRQAAGEAFEKFGVKGIARGGELIVHPKALFARGDQARLSKIGQMARNL